MKRKSKFINLITVSLICLILLETIVIGIPVFALTQDINVIVNGKKLEFEVDPVIVNNRVLVPLNVISESLHLTFEMDEKLSRISIHKKDRELIMYIGMEYAVEDDDFYFLGIPPQIIKNKIFVPIGFISTFFGANIEWDAITKTISIYNDDDDIIIIDDLIFEKYIRNLIDKPTGDLIKYDVRYITELNLNKYIDEAMEDLVDISALKYFENLVDLTIHVTEVSDLEPIKNLKKLEELNISLSPVENIDALKGLVNLKYLYIYNCPVSDLSPLTSLTELNVLSLTNCPVTDYSDLKSLVNLTNLWITDCPISDIEPVKDLTNLTDIRIRNTDVSDLSYLTNLSKLRRADLSYNKITDISPLKNLIKLENLDLGGNNILDYKPIIGMLPYLEVDFSMQQLAIDQAKIILKNIIKDNMSDLEKEKAIHDYIVLNTKYDIENYKNYTIPVDSHEAYGVILYGVGVCDGYAKATLLLLTLADIEAEIVTGAAKSSTFWESHAWNRVLIDGVWYNLDVTWDDPVPDRGPSTPRTKYFNMSDETFRINHRW